MKFKLCVLIFSFLLCNGFAFSQTKLLLKVNKCIKAGDLSEATEILENYKSKEGLTNAAILLGIKIDLRKSNNIENIESCETNLNNLLKSVGLSSNSEDVKIEMKKNSKAFNTMKLSLKKIFDDYVLQLS